MPGFRRLDLTKTCKITLLGGRTSLTNYANALIAVNTSKKAFESRWFMIFR